MDRFTQNVRCLTGLFFFLLLFFLFTEIGDCASVADTLGLNDIPELEKTDANSNIPADPASDSAGGPVVKQEEVPEDMRSQETIVPDLAKQEADSDSDTAKTPDTSGVNPIQSKAHEIVVLKQLSGPRQTVEFFLDSSRNNYADCVTTMDFSHFPELNQISREDYAYKLRCILFRLDNFSTSDIPETYEEDDCYLWPDHNFKAICLHRYEDGTWKFSPSSVSDIPAIYNEIRHKRPVFFKDTFLGQLPDFFYSYFCGFLIVQWCFLLVFIFLGLLMVRLIPFITSRIIMLVAKVRQHDKEFTKKFQWSLRPLAYIGMSWFWFAGLEFVGADPKALKLAVIVLQPLCVVMLMQLFLRLVDIFKYWLQIRLDCTVNKVKSVLVDLSAGVLKFLTLASGVIAIAQIFGISALGIVSGMGIGGVAVALAAQQTISNFFGSMTILMDHAFTVGDYIIVGSIEGIVERVGLRSTTIKTAYGSHVTIPNGQLATDVVDNLKHRQLRRFKTTLGLQYDTPIPLFQAFTAGVRRLIEQRPDTFKDDIRVGVNELGASSIDIQLICFFMVQNNLQELKARESLILDILELANKLGVSFAFPSQTTYMIPSENLNYPLVGQLSDKEAAYTLGKQFAEEIDAKK